MANGRVVVASAFIQLTERVVIEHEFGKQVHVGLKERYGARTIGFSDLFRDRRQDLVRKIVGIGTVVFLAQRCVLRERSLGTLCAGIRKVNSAAWNLVPMDVAGPGP